MDMHRRISLRPATAADLDRINSLIQSSAAYSGAYRGIIEGYVVTAGQIERDHMVVAEREGQLLGLYSLVTDGTPELDLMFVADEAQGLGIGALLFEDMRRTASSLGLAHVMIVSHPPSVGFYERMGAVRRGIKPPSGKVAWERPVLELSLRKAETA